tara:strand:- start:116 stop:784 length:669 start_codon:yes stop_codon:yes gene_type:complete
MATASTARLGANVTVGVKKPCVVATTANITLSGAQTIDDVLVAINERVLVMNQTDATENGVYIVASGTWTRAPEWDTSSDLASGVLVPVGLGTANVGLWQVTYSGNFSLGVTEPTFTRYQDSSASDSITAGTTQTQAGATVLTSRYNRISVCAVTNDGVALIPAIAGTECLVLNEGAESAQVWPADGDAIDAEAADAVDSNALTATSARRYVCFTDGTWQTT